MTQTLAGRVRALIDRVHDGSVNAAAKDLEIAQSTLAQIVSDQVKNPRTNALQAIATFYGASMDWLVSGVGKQPHVLDDMQLVPIAESLRWHAAVDRLGLSSRARYVLAAQPHDVLAHYTELDGPAAVHRGASDPVGSFRTVQRHSLLAWIGIVETIEAQLGRESARKYFEDAASLLALNLHEVRRELVRNRLSQEDVWSSLRDALVRAKFSPSVVEERTGLPATKSKSKRRGR